MKHLEETLPNSPFAERQLYAEGPDLFSPGTFNAEAYWTKISKSRINARYISPFAIILHEKGVYPKIGKGTWIGHFCVLDGSQGLVIGENCEISCGAQIYTHSTAKRCVLGETKETAPVNIEDSVFIGPNSIVSMGCHVGAHSIIGGLSVLDKYTVVTPYTFWAGIPAKFKKDVRRLK